MLQHSSTETQRIYLPSLDGLRFLAFLAVLIHHLTPPPSVAVLFQFAPKGWVGIELFFVISAFLFFTLFQAEYERTGRIAIADFFIRRLLRLYPLMVGAPLLFIALFYSQIDLGAAFKEFAFIALFAENLLWLGAYTNSIPYSNHLWTLSFEFQIYLMLPAVFLVCTKLGRYKAIMLLAGLSLVSLGFRAFYAFQHVPHPTIYFSPLLRPDSILLGMGLAMIAPYVRGHALIAAIAMLGGAAAFFLLPNVYATGASTLALFPAAAVMCSGLLWLTLNVPWLARFLGSPMMVYLGKRSFGLYVFHMAAIAFSNTYVIPHLTWALWDARSTFFAQMLVTLAVTIAMAATSYRFFERPFLYLKEQKAIVRSRPI